MRNVHGQPVAQRCGQVVMEHRRWKEGGTFLMVNLTQTPSSHPRLGTTLALLLVGRIAISPLGGL